MYWQKLRSGQDLGRIIMLQGKQDCDSDATSLRMHLRFLLSKTTNNEQLAPNTSDKLAGSPNHPSQIRITRGSSKEECFRINNVYETTSGLRSGRYRNRNRHFTPANHEGNWCMDGQATYEEAKTRALHRVSVQGVRHYQLARMAKRSSWLKNALQCLWM